MNVITRKLQSMTTYQLMLYFLLVLVSATIVLSAFGILPYSAWDILFQALLFVGVCKYLNMGIARVLKVQPNVESSLITGLILSLIAGPLSLLTEWYVLLGMSGAAILSKYLFVFRKSHIFNPAAFGVTVSALLFGYPASWWVGGETLVLLVLIGGILMMQKLRRWHLLISFFCVYLLLFALDALFIRGSSMQEIPLVLRSVLSSPSLLFFAFVMLVEPLTSPQTNMRRMWFGVFVAVVLFSLQRFVSSIPYSLEFSLLIGNIFSRVVSPDFRQAFVLRKKELVDSVLGHFYLEPTRAFSYLPGQFLEYTFSHPHPDARGIRRYYTIASSPTEKDILLTTRFSEPSSTFKASLKTMKEGDEITAAKVAGDFILPSDPKKKLAFIAGGIGITPFRSMVKYLVDTDESRDIVLLYGAREEKDVVFRDIFNAAQKRFGMKTVYMISQKIDEESIRKEIPDFLERSFYISGPEPMVQGISKTLIDMSIPRRQIKRDYFPGYGEEKLA